MAATIAPSPATVSIIAAMHARYEAAWANDVKIDVEQSQLGDSDQDHIIRSRLEAARLTIEAETDVLRLAILYQVPTCWADVLVLQYHTWGVSEMLADAEGRMIAVHKAMLAATTAIFNYLACELPDIDHEKVGSVFQAATLIAWRRTRTRNGELED